MSSLPDNDEGMLWWPTNGPEACGENYNHETIRKIKEGGAKKWLASLPMFEYAYVLVCSTAFKYGGTINRYIDDLYKTRMNPILKQYYDKLVLYRFHRAILEEHFESMKNVLTDTDVMSELAAMRVYAVQTRKALRGVVADFVDQLLGLRTSAKPTEDTLQEAYPM